jgi:hypothetical protein
MLIGVAGWPRPSTFSFRAGVCLFYRLSCTRPGCLGTALSGLRLVACGYAYQRMYMLRSEHLSAQR